MANLAWRWRRDESIPTYIVDYSFGEMTVIASPLRSRSPLNMPSLALVLAASMLSLTACQPTSSQATSTRSSSITPNTTLPAPHPAVIAASEGERRLLRGETPLLIKIDPLTTGSQRMVLGSSDLPPGDAIGMHRHLQEDEILLVFRGNAEVQLAGRKYEAGPGGAIYIPQGTCVAVANAGRDTLTTFFVFSSPGFEQVLREVSSRPGEAPKRLSPAERVAAFHRGHAVANPADC
jgi:quercetin dioxygenase-like cupin family protein